MAICLFSPLILHLFWSPRIYNCIRLSLTKENTFSFCSSIILCVSAFKVLITKYKQNLGKTIFFKHFWEAENIHWALFCKKRSIHLVNYLVSIMWNALIRGKDTSHKVLLNCLITSSNSWNCTAMMKAQNSSSRC